jgi:folate-dependent phosphoribosylglycinamide formyltransferase PurN
MRVALLIDDEHVQSYFAEALTKMVKETAADISLVVVNAEPGDAPLSYLRKAINRPDWARIVGGQKLWEQIAGTPSFRKPVSYESVMNAADAPTIHCRPVRREGFGNELPRTVIDQIIDDADVVVRNGFGVLKGDILTEPKHGVLSYHHGDPREYRGGPPGFWEFLHGRDSGGVIVQRLSPELDDGDVIMYREIDLRGACTWRQIQSQLFEASTDMLARAINRIEAGEDPVNFDEVGPVYTAPGLTDYVRYVVKNNLGRFRVIISGRQ